MIKEENLRAAGRITKTHGVSGEMVVTFGCDVPPWEELRCIFLMMDGLPVPFFVESSRPKSAESDLIMLDGVESEKEASALCGKTVYVAADELEAAVDAPDFSEGFYVDDLVGFRAVSDDGRLGGKIAALEASTANCLFIIETDAGTEVLVPAAGEFISEVDPERRTVTLSLPEGLLD